MRTDHQRTLRAVLSRHKKETLPLFSMTLKKSSSNIPERLRRATETFRFTMRMKSWSPTRHRKQHKDGSGRCYLMELPTELLLEIVSHLTLVPEAALALTCKRMLAISGSILKSQSLRFGRDFAPLFHHYRNGHNFATPRWQFLNLLEDGRWHICSKCLKLHPRAAFTSRELRRKPEHRSCNLGDLAGIVDLCPCKKLTFRDKLDLIDHLRVRRVSVEALRTHFGDKVGDRYCWHSCLENYGPTQMKISIYPELDENDQLRVRTEYEMTTEAGQVGKEAYMTPRFGCAHRSVDLWLSSVHQTSVCRLFDSYCTSCRRISVCGACNTSLKCPRKQPYNSGELGRDTFHFLTQRNLGGSKPVPDDKWASQRIHPAEPTIGVENCNELCPWTVREHPPLTFSPTIGEEVIEPAINPQPLSTLYTSIRML